MGEIWSNKKVRAMVETSEESGLSQIKRMRCTCLYQRQHGSLETQIFATKQFKLILSLSKYLAIGI